MKLSKNMKFKGLFLISVLFIFAIALVLSVNASKVPVISAMTWQDLTKINVSWSAGLAADEVEGDIRGVMVNITCSDTANSTGASGKVFNTTNSSVHNMFTKTHLNETFGFNYTLEDSVNCNAMATIFFNGTQTSSAATVAITIDRTSPSIPTSIVPTGSQTNNTLDFVSTVVGANTTGCNLIFIGSIPSGASRSDAMTHSGNLCTARYTSVSDSTYQFQIAPTDGTNSSIIPSQYITVSSDEPNLQGLGVLKQVEVKQQQQQKKSSNNNNLFFLVIGVIIVYLIMQNKKGRR